MNTIDRADESLNRAAWAVHRSESAETRVCYAVTSSQNGLLTGMREALAAIDRRCRGPIVVRSKQDGETFAANEIVMTIEGPFQQLVTLESELPGLLSLSAGARNLAAMVDAMGDAPVIDTSASRYPAELIAPLSRAAAVGGAQGTTTRAGHAAAHECYGIGNEQIRVGDNDPYSFYLYATVPHALTAVLGDSQSAAEICRESYPASPLSVAITFEGSEKEICSQAVGRFGSDLAAVVLDLEDNRLITTGHETRDRAFEMRILSKADDRQAAMKALDDYGFGPGVTIEAVHIVRDLLDSMGSEEVSLLIDGDMTPEKIRAFKAAGAPIDGLATASWVAFAPFSADIIRVFKDNRWQRRCKAGRNERVEEPDLPIRLTKDAP